MAWVFITLKWYFVLFLLGIVFFPLSQKIFGRFFPDQGYGFAKTLAILFLSYTSFVLGILKIATFSRMNLIIIIILFLLINLLLFKKNNTKYVLLFIIFEEVLFLAALIFWAFVRGQEPSIRDLEKFMDFGFINSILRSRFFPPLDMWLSADQSNPNGYFINYYYFGHLTGAVLIKLSGIKPAIGYNLILASTFALSVVSSFTLVTGLIYQYFYRVKNFIFHLFESAKIIFFGLLGSFIVVLGGNLHTIYVFTTGYPNEDPIPFWKILSWYNPGKYWYPNATRFIPNTIHEFPSYSWVVADMHGHVFDIPFVLLTLAILFVLFIKYKNSAKRLHNPKQSNLISKRISLPGASVSISFNLPKLLTANYLPLTVIFLGFLTAVHYMTNAFDGPIYILLTLVILFVLFGLTKKFFVNSLILLVTFILFSLPLSLNFKPFVAGIGLNCSPDFLVSIKKFGPFLFEAGNCQVSPVYMLFLLWGFFWVNAIIFLLISRHSGLSRIVVRFWSRRFAPPQNDNITMKQWNNGTIDKFIFILFAFGTFLIIIPEFFYIKDIYPAHFRANTMFKLGYQAFIMMGLASAYTFFKIKTSKIKLARYLFTFIFLFFFFFIAIYPLYSIPSFYGVLDRSVELDGSKWFENAYSEDGLIPEDIEIIDFVNANIQGQPVILEAQGDSYRDFERISAYTGLPTVAGWWVHEWLWRGSADVVGNRIPDIVNMFESPDIELTKDLLQKYHVSYVVISNMEKQKYPKLNEEKFRKIGKRIFVTTNEVGALYKVNL